MKNIDSELQFLRAKAGHSFNVEDRIGAAVSEMIRRSRSALRALLGEPDPASVSRDLKVPWVKIDPRGGFGDLVDGRPGGRPIDESATYPLPLSSGVRIKPNATATITARPQDLFRPHRIVIGGELDRWVVNDVKIGRRSQFATDGDIPGSAFSASAPIVPMDVVSTCGSLKVTVTYVGSVEEGEEFYGVAFGEYGANWQMVAGIPGAIHAVAAEAPVTWAYLPIGSGYETKISGSAEIIARPDEPFLTKKIVICGEPSRWVVEDIFVGNRSQLANKGEIPGDAFSLSGGDLRLDAIQTAMDFRLRVRYVGPVAGGEPFSAYAIGPIASLS